MASATAKAENRLRRPLAMLLPTLPPPSPNMRPSPKSKSTPLASLSLTAFTLTLHLGPCPLPLGRRLLTVPLHPTQPQTLCSQTLPRLWLPLPYCPPRNILLLIRRISAHK